MGNLPITDKELSTRISELHMPYGFYAQTPGLVNDTDNVFVQITNNSPKDIEAGHKPYRVDLTLINRKMLPGEAKFYSSHSAEETLKDIINKVQGENYFFFPCLC